MSFEITYFSDEPNYDEYQLQIRGCVTDIYVTKFLFICQEVPWTVKDLLDVMGSIETYTGPEKFAKVYFKKFRANVLISINQIK